MTRDEIQSMVAVRELFASIRLEERLSPATMERFWQALEREMTVVVEKLAEINYPGDDMQGYLAPPADQMVCDAILRALLDALDLPPQG